MYIFTKKQTNKKRGIGTGRRHIRFENWLFSRLFSAGGYVSDLKFIYTSFEKKLINE